MKKKTVGVILAGIAAAILGMQQLLHKEEKKVEKEMTRQEVVEVNPSVQEQTQRTWEEVAGLLKETEDFRKEISEVAAEIEADKSKPSWYKEDYLDYILRKRRLRLVVTRGIWDADEESLDLLRQSLDYMDRGPKPVDKVLPILKISEDEYHEFYGDFSGQGAMRYGESLKDKIRRTYKGADARSLQLIEKRKNELQPILTSIDELVADIQAKPEIAKNLGPKLRQLRKMQKDLLGFMAKLNEEEKLLKNILAIMEG